MQLIAATENAQIQKWDLAWTGQSIYNGSFDFREMLQTEILALYSSPANKPIKVLDMAITPVQARGDELASAKAESPLDLMLLVQSEDANLHGPVYTIANLVMDGHNARLERLVPIRTTITAASTATSDNRPRLLLPKPGHTAYIATQQQIIFVSLEPPEADGPNAQLSMESHLLPKSFQDSLSLRTGKHLAVEACCEEDLADPRGASACAIFVKGYGLVRVAANEPTTSLAKPTIRSKLEQAIFYGTMSDNIFDFATRPHDPEGYNMLELEQAALLLSHQILTSASPCIPPPTSMDAHMLARTRALRALIIYLRHNYPGMSMATRWALMLDAEKLAAAHAIWTVYDNAAGSGARAELIYTVLLAVKQRADRDHKTRSRQPDSDIVRQWFLTDIHKLQDLRREILQGITNMYEAGKHHNLMKLISEADDFIFNLYNTVFDFRKDNADVYGLDALLMSDGILEEGHEEISEPWTSNHEVFNTLNKFIDVARDFAVHFYDHPTDGAAAYVEKVVHENVNLVNILCMLYRERIAYVRVHYGDKGPQYFQSFTEAFAHARAHHLRLLSKIGQSGSGIAIAEKYRDMETLVKLVITESAYLIEMISEPGLEHAEKAAIQDRMDHLQALVRRYFKTFGSAWANAFFDSHLLSHHSYGLLKQADQHQEPLTKYLRAENARGRLSWINDVLREHDYDQASKTLSTLATEQENKVWNKKVELSLGKLATMAVQEDQGNTMKLETDRRLKQQQDDLAIIEVQEAIKAHYLPVTFAAVDLTAEIQLVTNDSIKSLKRSLPALYVVAENAIAGILKHVVLRPEDLIDLLTLMQSSVSDDVDSDISGKEFYLALKVLQAAKKDLDGEKFSTLLRLIWKRCWLKDNWAAVTATKSRSDRSIVAEVRDTIVCKTVMLGLKDRKYLPTSLT